MSTRTSSGHLGRGGDLTCDLGREAAVDGGTDDFGKGGIGSKGGGLDACALDRDLHPTSGLALDGCDNDDALHTGVGGGEGYGRGDPSNSGTGAMHSIGGGGVRDSTGGTMVTSGGVATLGIWCTALSDGICSDGSSGGCAVLGAGVPCGVMGLGKDKLVSDTSGLDGGRPGDSVGGLGVLAISVLTGVSGGAPRLGVSATSGGKRVLGRCGVGSLGGGGPDGGRGSFDARALGRDLGHAGGLDAQACGGKLVVDRALDAASSGEGGLGTGVLAGSGGTLGGHSDILDSGDHGDGGSFDMGVLGAVGAGSHLGSASDMVPQ
jgi:hypothetical protein